MRLPLPLSLAVVALTIGCAPTTVSSQIVVDDLSQPRGLAIDDSKLCVAEAGKIGVDGVDADHQGQLVASTGRVVCALLDGEDQVTAVDGLPFVYYPDAGVTSGVSDVVISGDTTYVLVGEAYGDFARSIVLVDDDGPQVVADLLEYSESLAVLDGGVRSNPYSFVIDPSGNSFYVTEAALGKVLRVGLDGAVEPFASVNGHEVLTGISWGPDGLLYVASFGQLPHPSGTGMVVAIDGAGNHEVVVDGLSMVIDVAVDSTGALFVLEYSTPPPEPTGIDAYRDNAGRLSYVPSLSDTEDLSVLINDLNRPTGLVVDNGQVLISVTGGELASGQGKVVRYEVSELLEKGRGNGN